MSKGKKMNKEKAGGRGVQMKVFTFRKRTTPETQPYGVPPYDLLFRLLFNVLVHKFHR